MSADSVDDSANESEDDVDEDWDVTDFMGGSSNSGRSLDDSDDDGESEEDSGPGLERGSNWKDVITDYIFDQRQDLLDRMEFSSREYSEFPEMDSSEYPKIVSAEPLDDPVVDIDFGAVKEWDEDLAYSLKQSPSYFERKLREALDQDKYTAVRIHGDDELSWRIGESSKDAEGDLVTVRASVVGRSNKTSVMDIAAFRCDRCGGTNYEPTRNDWSVKHPVECNMCERDGPFSPNIGNSTYFDYLALELEELPEEAVIEGDPETISAEIVRKELVDDFLASSGSRVEVTAKLKREQLAGKSAPKEFDTYLDITSVEVLDDDDVLGEMTDEDWEHIDRAREIARETDHDLLDVLAFSAHPTLRREAPMRGGMLSLAGAPGVNDNRGFMHMLLIGEPGEGKSEMHRRLMDVAPRSVSAHSGDSTEAGLTSAATQTSIGTGDTSDWILRPGLFPRAHKGHLFFDELDGMGADTLDSVLTPMADGIVEVSKAGKKATFPAETAVIATSNPVETTWRDDIPAAEQIPFKQSLVSRFDLIYPFFDDSTKEEDKELAEMILDDHSAEDESGPEDRIEWLDEPVPTETIRRYLSHVRQNIDPYIPKGSDTRARLRDGWVRLTNMDEDSDQAVGPRVMEALIRLSKASARLRMSPVVEIQDAEIAFDLLNTSFKQLGLWDNGSLDVGSLYKDPGQNETDQETRRKAIKQTIRELEEEGTPATEPRILEQMHLEVDPGMFEDEVEKMKKSGQLAVINENDGLEVL